MAGITSDQWEFVCYVEQFWRSNRCFPSDGEIRIELGIDSFQVAKILKSEIVKRNLEVRGIDVDKLRPDDADTPAANRRRGNAKRLSDIQLAVVSAVLNPADRRSVSAKLEALGVNPSTYAGWKKSRVFMDYMNQQGEALFQESLPEIHNTVQKRAIDGDHRFTKLAYEVTGFYRGQESQSNQNFQMLILGLIEILQRHISDPTVLKAIADEVKLLTTGEQTTPPVSVEPPVQLVESNPAPFNKFGDLG